MLARTTGSVVAALRRDAVAAVIGKAGLHRSLADVVAAHESRSA